MENGNHYTIDEGTDIADVQNLILHQELKHFREGGF